MRLLSLLPVRPVFIALVTLAALILALVTPTGLTPQQGQVLGIILVTLALWGTSIVPGYLASLIFFAVVLVLHLATPDLVFAGFGSTAIWLIVSGAVIGAAIGISGLGGMLARLLQPLLTPSYPRLIGGLMLVAMLLGFLMPSSVGRAAVLVPVGMALADLCGFRPGSNGRIGIAVVLAIGCNMPSFAILPSNIPNMVLAGAAETIHKVGFGYMEYLVLHYPVLGIVKSVLTVALVLRAFPDRIGAPLPTASKGPEAAAVSPAVRLRVGLLLLVTLVLWMTDSLHGINAAWVGLVTAVLLLMPGIGVVSPQAFRNSVDFGTLLFVVGALALGSLVNASGLGGMLAQALEGILPLREGAAFVNFLSLSAISALTGLFTTVPGVPAVLTPMAADLSAQSGMSLQAVLMTQVIGFSTVLFPYQVVPLAVAMQLSGEKLSHLLRVTLPLAALTLVVLVPADFLWWRLMGWL